MAKVELRVRCFNLPALDFFSKSDPLVIVYTKIDGEEDKWERLDQTECVSNHLAPVFAKVITLDWNVKTELKFEVLDMDDSKLDDLAKAQYVGHYLVSLADLVCIGGATGAKHLRWKNGNVLVNGSISIHATLIGDDGGAAVAQAKQFVEVVAQSKLCTLYWSPYCPSSLAVLAVVKNELLKEVRLQQLGKDAQNLEINPTGALPFLDDAGFRLNGANTILRYLCQKYPVSAGQLYPNDLQGRAKVEQALDWHLNNTSRGWAFLAPRFGTSVDQAAQDEGKRRYEDNLSGLESKLAKENFLAGPTITLPDIVAFVELALLPAEMTAALPNVSRWIQAMTAYDTVLAEAKRVMV
jgi:glutathione S-transferase